METRRLTVGQALVTFLDNQYILADGQEIKFVEGVATIFGHGIVLGLGQALDEDRGALSYYQGKNEQGIAHMATAFARQHNRRRIIAVAASIGPGSANMVTAAACASVNCIPLLLLCGDTFATRQPDPVLQQLEREESATITTNDAFRPVCKYWDRVNRPEQLMAALLNAFRVLTDPAATGAVCLALPQDVQGECFDWPLSFLQKRVHRLPRPLPGQDEIETAAALIRASRFPLVICGGGVKYSGAAAALQSFCEQTGIPFAETQAGKSALPSSHPLCLGGIGVTGNLAANTIAQKADCVIGVGTRLSDFTTSSKWLFPDGARLVSLNASRFHACKMDAAAVVGDAREALGLLQTELQKGGGYRAGYNDEIALAKTAWDEEMQRLAAYSFTDTTHFKTLVEPQNPASIPDFVAQLQGTLTQTEAICAIRRHIAPNAIVVGASGSLPGDLQRMWTTDCEDSYHMEYGYSCMGYEIAGALGAKIACPQQEVYAMVGDGSFYMLHSELLTAIQEKRKINILLFDNAGFGCINNLEMANGVGNLGTEFRYKENGEYSGGFLHTDFAAIAQSYGAAAYRAHTLQELEQALQASCKETRCTLIDMKVLPKTMTEGYASWWHTGVAAQSKSETGQKAYNEKEKQRKKARLY